jgi:hypothetical protein
MRAFGYTTPAAVADIVDNSLSARARNIWIDFHWSGANSVITVRDDGTGMDESELVQAMRLGSRSPRENREERDLGRFGLGLKTASFSQCRDLTVLSRPDGGPISARRWDLDYVQQAQDWALLTEPGSAAQEASGRLEQSAHGTMVVWEKLDRLVGDDTVEDGGAHERFLATVRHVEEHLAMTFHRFLEGPRNTKLHLNGELVKAWDPFLEEHPATQRLGEERLRIRRSEIVVAPFVLPHHSKLSQDEHRTAAGPNGWNAHQGFYIYRGGRLLVPGEWLRLFQKEEHCKLARIRIELPNSLDDEWQIDVKKANARLPGVVRADLRRIAELTRKRAAAIYRHRGKAIARSSTKDHVFVWRQQLRAGKLAYSINRSHPLIARALNEDADVEAVLRLVEETIPAPLIALDASQRPDQQAAPFEAAPPDELIEMAQDVYGLLRDFGLDHSGALAQMAAMEPFDTRPEVVAHLEEAHE